MSSQHRHGLILAGGAGRRVGGRDKGLIEQGGVPLVAQSVLALHGQVDTVWISCNRNREVYADYAPLIPVDRRTDYQGPLAGLEAAVDVITDGFILLMPCDNPEPPERLGDRLFPVLAEGFEACYPTDGQRGQYLYGALRSSVLPTVSAYLDSDQRSVRGWLDGLNTCTVDCSDLAGRFHNHNSLSD